MLGQAGRGGNFDDCSPSPGQLIAKGRPFLSIETVGEAAGRKPRGAAVRNSIPRPQTPARMIDIRLGKQGRTGGAGMGSTPCEGRLQGDPAALGSVSPAGWSWGPFQCLGGLS